MDKSVLGDTVQDINRLTVIASDGYRDFVKDLQKEIREDLYERPTKASIEYFENKHIKVGENVVTVSSDQARAIYNYLVKNDYVDDDGKVTEKYHADTENGTLAPLSDKIKDLGDGVHKLVQGIFDEKAFDNLIEDANKKPKGENKLNDNFFKKEFQTLWNYINHKYTYTVKFDSDELIKKAIAHIDDKMFVAKMQYTVTSGHQDNDLTADKIKNGGSFVDEKSHTYDLKHNEGSQIKYDLIGQIASGTHLTRRTTTAILKGISPFKFAMYQNNPEEFISKAIKLINEQKATMIVDDITYNQTDGTYDSSIFTTDKNKDFKQAYIAKKNVQDYIFPDSIGEKNLAEDMDRDDKVVVYAKLPRGFQIPTPVGNYAPDWAIAFQKGTVKHIFFVAETKGSMSSMDLKPIEQAKIRCAKKLFNELSNNDVVYHEVNTYENLLSVMNSI